MNQISKSRFKAKALEFFREIETTGEPLIITDQGQPKLEIRRYKQPTKDLLEQMRGTVLHYDRPFDPVGEEDWEALK